MQYEVWQEGQARHLCGFMCVFLFFSFLWYQSESKVDVDVSVKRQRCQGLTEQFHRLLCVFREKIAKCTRDVESFLVAPLIVRVLAQPDRPVLNVTQLIYVMSED